MLPSLVHEEPSGPRFYRPELDILRFFAFLLVFLRHIETPAHHPVLAAIFSSGRAGVCLFFLLSAYLITELLEREAAKTQTVDLRAFYMRRILRVWPLYFFALLIARLIDWHAPHLQMSNGRLLASVLLAGNWYTYVYGLPASFALVLWSISVEEQFYLIWPSVRRISGSRGLLFISLLTFPISYASMLWLASSGHKDLQLWVNTFVQVQFFGVGGLLALQLRGWTPHHSRMTRAVLFGAGLFTLFAGQYYVHDSSEIPNVHTVALEYGLMLLASLLIFFSVYNFEELRREKTLIYLGKISYGLYVFQILGLRLALRPATWLGTHLRLSSGILQTFQDLLGLVLTIVLAALSYRYLESYFLRLKEHFAIIRTRSV